VVQPYRFQGAYQDSTGLYEMGDRYYDPTTGRWTQPDPDLDVTNPGQSNAYVFAGDDPVNETDPTGLAEFAGVIPVWKAYIWAKAIEVAVAANKAPVGLPTWLRLVVLHTEAVVGGDEQLYALARGLKAASKSSLKNGSFLVGYWFFCIPGFCTFSIQSIEGIFTGFE
jgi:RHS repeat-associated protein